MRKILKPTWRQRLRVFFGGGSAEDRQTVDSYKRYRRGLTSKGKRFLLSRNKDALEFFGSQAVSNEHRKALVKNLLKGTDHEKYTDSILEHFDYLHQNEKGARLKSIFSHAHMQRAVINANEKFLPQRLLNLLTTASKAKKEVLAAGLYNSLKETGFYLKESPGPKEPKPELEQVAEGETGAEGAEPGKDREAEVPQAVQDMIEGANAFSSQHGLKLSQALKELSMTRNWEHSTGLSKTAREELKNSTVNSQKFLNLAVIYASNDKKNRELLLKAVKEKPGKKSA